jgi:hypothetical protein
LAPALQVVESGKVFYAYTESEAELRRRYLALDGNPSTHIFGRTDAETLLRRSARLLELFAVADCALEAIESDPSPDDKLPPPPLESLAVRVSQTCGLDVVTVLNDALQEFQPDLSAGPEQQRPSISALVRFTQSLLAGCPIDGLEQIGRESGLENWSHRCRVAFDSLSAFVLRNDQRERSKRRFIGRAYSRGQLSGAEVGLVLGVPTADALGVLEQEGYRRALEVIQMDDSQRGAILDRVRSDRLERGGQPSYSHEYVNRDVVASERIEGVDARAWVTREPSL